MGDSTEGEPDYEAALGFAKDTLRNVGRFRTPPTPEIYEVWYRYAAGGDPSITEQITQFIDERGSVTFHQLIAIHRQFCESPHADVHRKLSNRLEGEVRGLESAIATQMTAGEEFGSSIQNANQEFSKLGPSSAEVATEIGGLIEENTNMLSHLQRMQTRLQQSQEHIAALKSELASTQKDSMTDPLTGVGNRRCFNALLDTALQQRCAENIQMTVLILIDLDEFKQVNDTLGHAVGDQLLAHIAHEIQALNKDAMVARYGGDEFGVFLRVNDRSDAVQFAEAIRESVSDQPLQHADSGAVIEQVTLSIGGGILRNDDTAESWFNRVDKLLYAAKKSGRNRVCFERH